jgi:hypothetical protein
MAEASLSEKPSEDAIDAPWRWSASRMARAIRDKTVSVEEMVSSCLERIDAVKRDAECAGRGLA